MDGVTWSLLELLIAAKNSKIWDIGPKSGRGSRLNPNFFSLIGTNTVGGRGQKVLVTK